MKFSGTIKDISERELAEAARSMGRFGGSFASAIADAYFVADHTNSARLLNAFQDLFVKYHTFNKEREQP